MQLWGELAGEPHFAHILEILVDRYSSPSKRTGSWDSGLRTACAWARCRVPLGIAPTVCHNESPSSVWLPMRFNTACQVSTPQSFGSGNDGSRSRSSSHMVLLGRGRKATHYGRFAPAGPYWHGPRTIDTTSALRLRYFRGTHLVSRGMLPAWRGARSTRFRGDENHWASSAAMGRLR